MTITAIGKGNHHEITYCRCLTAIILLPLSGCFEGRVATDELSYQVDQPLTGLVIGAQAASVDISVGDGPVIVTEKHS